MDKKDFFYNLPEELIAQRPLENRAASRLLALDKETGEIRHRQFTDILDYLNPGDCLVINDTKVIPSRLLGESPGGARVEILLLKRLEGDLWEALAKPGKKVRPGAEITFGGGLLKCMAEGIGEGGVRLVRFYYSGIFEEILDKLGEMPLPPYITEKLGDKSRYQTVYAKNQGSAAAPTAGFHFTGELLEKIKEKGVEIANITLHVGLGTFRPVKTENIFEHKMHSEYCQISPKQADTINAAKKRGGKVIAVGTTSCRSIESFGQGGVLTHGSMDTDIFIYPGYEFKITDGLITNFHLPESTLIMLVSALSTREFVLRAYEEAVREKYRFYSFGDCMLII